MATAIRILITNRTRCTEAIVKRGKAQPCSKKNGVAHFGRSADIYATLERCPGRPRISAQNLFNRDRMPGVPRPEDQIEPVIRSVEYRFESECSPRSQQPLPLGLRPSGCFQVSLWFRQVAKFACYVVRIHEFRKLWAQRSLEER